MPVERRGWVTHGVCWVNGRPEELSCLAGRRQPSLSGTSRMRRESHVRMCVQRRLACSAGDKPAGAKIRSLVVWIAGWRETKTLKPIDNVSRGEPTSHRAVTTVNANVASKVSSPEGRAPNRRAKAAWGAEIRSMRLQHFGGVEATARWQGHAEQLEKPSSSRREIAGAGSMTYILRLAATAQAN